MVQEATIRLCVQRTVRDSGLAVALPEGTPSKLLQSHQNLVDIWLKADYAPPNFPNQ
jgi:hypothetical protein